jgi:hypothetical protein
MRRRGCKSWDDAVVVATAPFDDVETFAFEFCPSISLKSSLDRQCAVENKWLLFKQRDITSANLYSNTFLFF